jgi:transposase
VEVVLEDDIALSTCAGHLTGRFIKDGSSEEFVDGTIVVDLEGHTVIDVFDQHSSEAVEPWLGAHPDIQMICWDRYGRYAKAARTAGPAARQVTDRFHLVQHLCETIEGVLRDCNARRNSRNHRPTRRRRWCYSSPVSPEACAWARVSH